MQENHRSLPERRQIQRLVFHQSRPALKANLAVVVDNDLVFMDRAGQKRRQMNEQITHTHSVDFLQPPAAFLLLLRLHIPLPPGPVGVAVVASALRLTLGGGRRLQGFMWRDWYVRQN